MVRMRWNKKVSVLFSVASLACGNIARDEDALEPSLTTPSGGGGGLGDDPLGGGSGGDSSGGGTGGGGSGGDSSGGGTGGAATGGQGSGGLSSVESSEFVISLPYSTVQFAHPLVATPHASMLTISSEAPAAWLPDQSDSAVMAELSASGEVLRVLAFEELAEPTLIAVDSEGAIFLLGTLVPDSTTHFLSFELMSRGNQAYLIKLAPDFSPLHAEVITFSDSEHLAAMAVDPAGDVVVTSSAYTPEDIDVIERPRMSKFSGTTLLPIWSTLTEHTAIPAYPRAITTLPDGTAVTGGAYHGELTVGETVLPRLGPEDEPGVSAAWLAWFGPETGAPSRAEAIGGEQAHYVHGLQTTSTGNLRVLGSFTGVASVFGQPMDFGVGRVAVFELNSQAELQWFTPIEYVEDFYARALAMGSQDQSYLVGAYGDRLGDPSQVYARLLRIEADGSIGEHLDIFTGSPNGASTVAVDTLGGVWMSADWEAPFEYGGVTYTPDPEGCQFILRKVGF